MAYISLKLEFKILIKEISKFKFKHLISKQSPVNKQHNTTHSNI